MLLISQQMLLNLLVLSKQLTQICIILIAFISRRWNSVHCLWNPQHQLPWSNSCLQTQTIVSPLKPTLKWTCARLSSSSGITSMSNFLISIPILVMPVDLSQTMVNETQAINILHRPDYIDAFESSTLNINLCDSQESASVVIPSQPITFVVPTLIQGQTSKKFLSVLLDTGSDGSFIHSQCILPGVKLTQVEPRAVIGLHQSQQYNCKELWRILLSLNYVHQNPLQNLFFSIQS